MTRYAAFLRGMNVGKHHRVTSAELRDVFERSGCTDVTTFRTSGNVLFASEGESEAEIVRRSMAVMDETFGYAPNVFVRSADELGAISAADPFSGRARDATRGKEQVVFLERKPTAAARRALLAHATEDDLLAIVGRDLRWSPIGSVLDTGLDLAAIGKLAGSTTTRTLGTVELIVAKLTDGA